MIVEAVGQFYVKGLKESKYALEQCYTDERKEQILPVFGIVDKCSCKIQPVICKEMHRILAVEHISGGILTGIKREHGRDDHEEDQGKIEYIGNAELSLLYNRRYPIQRSHQSTEYTEQRQQLRLEE